METLPCQPTLQGQCADLSCTDPYMDISSCLRAFIVMLFSSSFFFILKVSDTYPADLFVPESATPPVIVGSSKFRSRGRFPALSYYSKENHVSWPFVFYLFHMLHMLARIKLVVMETSLLSPSKAVIVTLWTQAILLTPAMRRNDTVLLKTVCKLFMAHFL